MSAPDRTNPPCCPPGKSLPYLPEDPSYEPRGEIVDLPPCEARSKPCRVYLSDCRPSKSDDPPMVIVMMHDIFGPFSGRHRVLVDVIAKRLNALVVLPDCFDGQGGVKVRYYIRNTFSISKLFQRICSLTILLFPLNPNWAYFCFYFRDMRTNQRLNPSYLDSTALQ